MINNSSFCCILTHTASQSKYLSYLCYQLAFQFEQSIPECVQHLTLIKKCVMLSAAISIKSSNCSLCSVNLLVIPVVTLCSIN